MQLISLISTNRARWCTAAQWEHSLKASAVFSRLAESSANRAIPWGQDPHDDDANYHDGWQPIRLRQPAQEGE
jgi:hypothetical protein